jgi:hypothetical protein
VTRYRESGMEVMGFACITSMMKYRVDLNDMVGSIRSCSRCTRTQAGCCQGLER